MVGYNLDVSRAMADEPQPRGGGRGACLVILLCKRLYFLTPSWNVALHFNSVYLKACLCAGRILAISVGFSAQDRS